MVMDRNTFNPVEIPVVETPIGELVIINENSSLKELSEFAAIATSLADSKDSLADSRNTSEQEDDSDLDQDGRPNSHKRLEHNICERRRRNNIRQGFEALQGGIPHATMKLSKMEILRTGISYIGRLGKEISELEDEVKALREQKAT